MTFSIPDFRPIKVTVIGDVMLDRYWHGATNRISPEAPVPVVHIQDIEERPGGAGNVALNLRVLGCQTQLFGLVGSDLSGETLNEQLKKADIHTFLQRVIGMPTITKLRVLGRNQQLIRCDFEQNFHHVDPSKLISDIKENIAGSHVMLISDYNKGVTHSIREFINIGRAQGIPILIDPKSSDFSVYRGATLLTPNQKEFEAVVGVCSDDETLVDRGFKLIEKESIDAVLVTRGERGMTLIQQGKEAVHFKAYTKEVYDVTGAGDTVIATMAAAIGANMDLNDAAMLANTAAGIAVGRVGAVSVTVPEIRRTLHGRFESGFGVLNEDDLMIAIADARAHGEKIVMTNGCFDILHTGHVTYLEQAKTLGDRLLIAVNTDESVANWKGPSRPIVPLAQRMHVLSALRCVDWVVPFSESTPLRLIQKILPDVLVKGGDYQIDTIVGAKEVMDNGGQVKIIEFVPGCSTSNIIARSQKKSDLVEEV